MLNTSGVFQDGYLMLFGNSKDRRKRIHMTYLANITSGGLSLKGMHSFVDSGLDEIFAIETTFTRKGA